MIAISVRASARGVSEIEYENTYSKLYDYLSTKIKGLPSRYGNYLGKPFNSVLNDTYRDIIKLTELFNSGKGKSVERYRVCVKILDEIKEIINFSYTFWNLSCEKNKIKYVKAKSKTYWANFVNKEIRLIVGVMNKCNHKKAKEVSIPFMNDYTRQQIKNVVFLNKLSRLQQIIYRRAVNTSKCFRDAQMEILVKCSRNALYEAFEGNSIKVRTDENLLKKRKKHISNAISELYTMYRPVRELAYAHVFTEGELTEICQLITDCGKILRAVRDSDQERFDLSAKESS